MASSARTEQWIFTGGSSNSFAISLLVIFMASFIFIPLTISVIKELEAIAAAVVGGCLLTGGYGSENCENNTDNCWYGKISKAWEWGSTPTLRLKDWLDPDDTGDLLLEGTYVVFAEYILGDVNSD